MAGVAGEVLDPTAAEEFLRQVATLPGVGSPDEALRAPDLVRTAWLRLVELTGDPDMLAAAKRRQMDLALALLPEAEERVARSADPFALALRLAIAGNALDAMVTVDAAVANDLLARLEELPLEAAALEHFRARVNAARRIVWFSDNCGEVVFDGLLLRVLHDTTHPAVTYVTRTVPALNDALPAEAVQAGIDRVATIMPNGSPDALPGTDFPRLDEAVRRLVQEADLVVAKGGGNYETLDEEPELAGKVTFLLEGKCEVLCGEHRAAPHQLIIANR